MRSRPGSAMILTLVVLTAVIAILANGIQAQQTHFRSVVNRIERDKARRMANSGIYRALAALTTLAEGTTGQADEWFTFGEGGAEKFLVGNGSFRAQIVDSCAFVNLNTAQQAQLELLNLTTEQVDSLLDWRETDTTPRIEGAKDEYYNQLTTAYNAKLGRLDSLDELLLVRGFTPSAIYEVPEQTNSSGYDPLPLSVIATVDSFGQNVTPDGQAKTNINTATVQQMVQAGLTQQQAVAIQIRRQSGTFTTMGDVLRVAGINNQAAGIILDNFGINGEARTEGKINLNTAREEVLVTVEGVTSDIAQAIVSRQTTGFASYADLLQIPGFSLTLLQQTADFWTLKSDTFIVRTTGTVGSATVCREAVITVENGVPRITKMIDCPFDNMASRWQWPDETTTETDLGGSQ